MQAGSSSPRRRGTSTTFLTLVVLFAGWFFVGRLNDYLLVGHSLKGTLSVLVTFTWLLSGPVWAFLFIRWRGKRFRSASDGVQKTLLSRTQERLKNHSLKG
jgi:hypothetical protein